MLWIREVDGTLKKYLTEMVKDLDIPVRMYFPKTDSQVEEYPLISIHGLEPSFNVELTDLNSYSTTLTSDGKVLVEDSPRKYDFVYNVNFYTKDPLMVNDIAFRWVSKDKKLCHIDVFDSEGIPHQALMTRGVAQRMDFTNLKGEVIYRRIYNVIITVGITTTPPKTYGYIKDLDIDVNFNKEV